MNCTDAQLKRVAVCELHFEAKMFNCPALQQSSMLLPTAFPTLQVPTAYLLPSTVKVFDQHNVHSNISINDTTTEACASVDAATVEVSTQTDLASLKHEIAILKLKLKAQIMKTNKEHQFRCRLQRRIRSLTRTLHAYANMTPFMKKFFKSQCRAFMYKKKGMRWSSDDINMALCIYLRSSQAYAALRQFMRLPCVNTIRKHFNFYLKRPGVSHCIMDALSSKVASFNSNDRLAILFNFVEFLLFQRRQNV